MTGKWLPTGVAVSILLAGGCSRKTVQTPPAPLPPVAKQNVFVLLPDPEGRPGAIVVRNPAGAQDLSQPYQAVRVERPDVAPSAPFPLDQAEVRRLFGAALDVLPAAEVSFVLHFDEGRDVLTAESAAQVPAILNIIRQSRSTSITVTGHTDTTADSQFNKQLGMRRAQGVALILIAAGVNESDLFLSSHGDADLLVPTGRGEPNAQNRRVEVIVR
jgi:outer membrane protein OmpA-like peptidoglycan-associated protein